MLFVALLRIYDLKGIFLGWMQAAWAGFYKERILFTFRAKTGPYFLPKLCADMVSPRRADEYNKTVPNEQA